MQEIVINNNEAGQRFDKFLFKYFKEASSGFIYKMLRKKNILLNGAKSDGKDKLNVGDTVKIFMSDETIKKFRGECEHQILGQIEINKLNIAYEDENVIVVNKEAGMLSQKAEKNDISVNEYIISYLLQSKQLTIEQLKTFTPGVCNRLDRNTSGLIVAGKTLIGLQIMSDMFQNRTMDKYYLTIVAGQVNKREKVKGYLVKDKKTNKVFISKNDNKNGQYIETEYEPLGFGEKITLLKVKLLTGRSHQIRAHLASQQHPVIGDFKYGNRGINQYYKEQYGLTYQLLHSWKIRFPKMNNECKSLSGKTITAEAPEIFKKIITDKITQGDFI